MDADDMTAVGGDVERRPVDAVARDRGVVWHWDAHFGCWRASVGEVHAEVLPDLDGRWCWDSEATSDPSTYDEAGAIRAATDALLDTVPA